MIVRRASVIAAIVASVVLLSGCDGTPEPVKTTPLFSSEEEAFAAAEQTYREYVEALNQQANQLADAADPTSLLVGSALEAELESQRQLEADGERIGGTYEVLWFEGQEFNASAGHVVAAACLDVSATRIFDVDGVDITPDARAPHVPLNLDLTPVSGRLMIESIASEEGERDC